MSVDFKNTFGSLANFDENLKTFEKALNENPFLALDKEYMAFIEIFKSIENCGGLASASQLVAFQGRISTAEKLVETVSGNKAESSFINDKGCYEAATPMPLLGKPRTLKSLADEYALDCPTKQGLLLLDSEHTFRSIRGDGHCLFRALAASVLEYVIEHPEAADQIIARLATNHPAQSAILQAQFDKLQESSGLMKKVGRLFQEKLLPTFLGGQTVVDRIDPAVEKIIGDQQISDSLVKTLRELAVAYEQNEVNSDPAGPMAIVLASDEAGDNQIDTYWDNMKDMSLEYPYMGGYPELLALEKMLGIGINILDTESSAHKGSIVETAADDSRPVHEGKLHILHRGAHYDLAVKKL